MNVLFPSVLRANDPYHKKLSQDEVDALKKLDFNDDGKLDTEEIKLGLAHKVYPDLIQISEVQKAVKTRPDHRVSPQDYQWLYDRSDSLKLAVHDFERRYPDGNPISLSSATLPDPGIFGLTVVKADSGGAAAIPTPGSSVPAATPGQDKEAHVMFTFSLWRDDKDLSLNDDLVSGVGTPPTSAKPAQFSFQDDFNKRQDTFSARGIAMEQIDIPLEKASTESPYVSDLWVVPAIGFDRVSIENLGNSNGSKKAEVNNLDFKVGFQSSINNICETNPGDPNNPEPYSQLLKLGFHQSTDFDFRKKITGAEFDSQPILPGYGNTIAIHPFQNDWIVVRWIASFHAEGGFIGNPGSVSTLESYSDFCRMGGYAQMDLWPAQFDQLRFSASYLYYKTVEGGSPSAHGYDLNLTYNIDPKGNYSVTAEYEDEVEPFTIQKVHTLTLGVGLKF